MNKPLYLLVLSIFCLSINTYGLNNLLFQDDTCSVNILQNDTVITSGSTVQIQLNAISSADSCRWFPSTGLSNPTSFSPIATVSTATQYIVETYYLTEPNLVYNGDFELGNTGFTTDLNYQGNVMPAGTYNVGLTADQFYWYFASCTNGTMAMIGNGATAVTHPTVYDAMVNNIEPNTSYVCSFESANIAQNTSLPLSLFQFSINGTPIGDIFEIAQTPCQMTTFNAVWHNTNATTAQLRILNQSTISDGNDFILDNITMKKICKATDTINIVFAENIVNIDTVICGNELPFNFYDTTFTESGTYFYNTSTNVFQINLTVLEPYINTIDATICEGETYTENGFNESTQGVYIQELQSINGCDSTIILNLSVQDAFHTNLQATICEGETYYENGFNESTQGVHTRTLSSVGGCDSIITLNLQVVNLRDTVIYDTIYSGTAYTRFGFNRTEEGTYFNTYQIGEGCPLNITLYLTVIIIPEINVWLPNAFTPYDVSNIEFGYYTELQYLESVLFQVYNRWGNKIFESTKIGEYWDGTYEGRFCNGGLYVWKLKYKTLFEDKTHQKSGNVHLIW
ncbi:MAG: gliding motility-associated C-terminal domain-containing protein [Bacteroidales bacterium]|jgi:gliding motility-associated-like protein|nr:gliding motility-associated C-terminal domain-containing protein [Bacteroidales bacterium]MDD4703093.1 gliding motility-associated C-terminal domain-containing protein [Bacteroidales bacterium]MDX9798239.1 gliding motility-associated C-terminal domain-containing protein [Bacteroidales bacterium]